MPHRWRTVGVAVVAVLLIMLGACGGATIGTVAQPVLALPGHISAGSTVAVTYCNGQVMKISEPAQVSGALPAVMYVHGGGWLIGDLNSGGYVNDLRPTLLKLGFVVVTINYRLAPISPWPAQIEDVMCAVRFLRAHAAQLHIDPSRIGAWGDSAGGQLVSLLGTVSSSSGWEVGPYLKYPSTVEAVVDMYGVADLVGEEPQLGPYFAKLFGSSYGPDDNELLRSASPVDQVSPGAPPFLILQGTDDQLVPAIFSEEFYNRLQAAGGFARLVLVAGGQHGLTQKKESPDQAELEQMVVGFFAFLFRVPI
jgi:acetyl esterase/lipase